jgi:hypothetical protein
VTVDGATGEVFDGVLEIAADADANPALETLTKWLTASQQGSDGRNVGDG